MKKLPAQNDTALAVQILDSLYGNTERTKFPALTLKEASKKYRKYQNAVCEEGGENLAGALVFHPVKGLVAWVSMNGRVWSVSSRDEIIQGGKKEFTGDSLVKNFNQVFA